MIRRGSNPTIRVGWNAKVGTGPQLLTRFRLPAVLVVPTILYGKLGYLVEGWGLTERRS
jgi:hypothetical protein